MVRPVVIGVDTGTTAVKAVAFTPEGAEVADAHRTVPLRFGRRGEVECDMAAIWDAVGACLREVTAALDAAPVLAVGVTGQGDGLWLLDASGGPVGPAPCWMDGRAAERVATWEADGRAAAVLDVVGTTTYPGTTPLVFAELAETRPEVIGAAAHALYCKDWVRYNLTGRLGTDFTEASRALLDVRTLTYSRDLAGHLGVEDLVDLLVPVSPSEQLAGVVTPAAAEATGLPAGTPVAVGLLDVAACGLGLGAVEDGDGWLILGTTGCVGVLLPKADARRSAESMVMASGRGTQAIEFLVPTSGTPNLEWARRTLGLGDLGYDEAERLAEGARPGSGGVLYLPYGAPIGARAPFRDSNASAAWVGLGYSTTPGQALRAVYEGMAYALAECVEELRLTGDLVVSGGGSRSRLLCQILADTMQRPVVRQDTSEAGARGAAITALVASGHRRDLREGADLMGTPTTTFAPQPAHAAVYAEGRALLARVRDALQPTWADLRHHRTTTNKENGSIQ